MWPKVSSSVPKSDAMSPARMTASDGRGGRSCRPSCREAPGSLDELGGPNAAGLMSWYHWTENCYIVNSEAILMPKVSYIFNN